MAWFDRELNEENSIEVLWQSFISYHDETRILYAFSLFSRSKLSLFILVPGK